MRCYITCRRKGDCAGCDKKDCLFVLRGSELCFSCTKQTLQAVDCEICSRGAGFISEDGPTPIGVICQSCFEDMEEEEEAEEQKRANEKKKKRKTKK